MTKSPPGWMLWSAALFINLIWAAAYPLSKSMMVEFPPLGLACWRMVGGAVVLLPFMKKSDFPAKVRFADILLLLSMGLVGCGLSTCLQLIATTRTLASNISLIVALETLFVMIIAHFVLRERARAQGWAGSVLAFLGVTLITVEPESLSLFASENLQGNLLMVASVICYSVYTIVGKMLCERWGSATLTALPFAMASVVLVPYFYLTDPAAFERASHPQSAYEWQIIVLVGCIGAGAGYLIWNWIIKYMSAGKICMSLYFQPVAGILLSLWLLGERISGLAFGGAALILGGVAMSEWRFERDSGVTE